MAMASVVPRYTAAEIRRFPDDRLRYEVIRGDLVVSPAPGTRHQLAVLELATRLKAYVDAHRLGIVLAGPFEIEFTGDSAVQPDVLVILNDRLHQLTDKRLNGAPSLVVEVVSYSSKRTDRLQKRQLYLEEGVLDYWIVDTELRHVERWRPGAEAPEVLDRTLVWEPVAEVPPLTIDVNALFRGLPHP
jgi:Uma2 family endonuclease